MTALQNDQLMLICGESAGGKSASLRSLQNQEGVMYLNCEAGKKLPCRNKFKSYTITDPLQVIEAMQKAEEMPEIHTVVVDSLTFLMDMFESVYVIPAADGMKAWSSYAQFFKNLMQTHVAGSSKNIIFTAHTLSVLNEADMVMEKKVPIKGALKNNGLEAYFSTIVAAKKMDVTKLAKYKNKHLVITEEEAAIGIKYVYQTLLTKETVNERIRSSMSMWDTSETFIDNDAQIVLDRLHEYYS